MTQKAQTLSEDIEKTAHVADPKALQAKMDQVEQVRMDIKRKAEDAQSAYDKRREDVFKPLQVAIGNAIEVYAKAHNIGIIIDGSQVPLSYASDAVDITRDFINDFNIKNPVIASTPAK